MWPGCAGWSPDWRTWGSSPRVAHQLGRTREPPDVADDREDAGGGHEADAGDGQPGARPGIIDDGRRDGPIGEVDLGIEDGVEPERGVEGETLVGRQLGRCQPGPAA